MGGDVGENVPTFHSKRLSLRTSSQTFLNSTVFIRVSYFPRDVTADDKSKEKGSLASLSQAASFPHYHPNPLPRHSPPPQISRDQVAKSTPMKFK